MTVAIAPPFIHVEDSNGNPYVSAKLYVYQVNTTTLASIYSDTALSVAITNPMTSDASGNFARAYIAAGTYKLRAETSAAVLIWQYDYIDTGLVNSGTLPIASGGTAATTAAAARTSLAAAAQTDVDNLSSSITTLSASLQALVSLPQGRLTLTTGTPVIAASVVAGTSVYYTPFLGNQVPIWNGTQFVLSTFAELTLTLAASHSASNIYDVFIWLESGVVTIGTGPAWTTPTAAAGARGSGAGTTELVRKNGLWVNNVAMTTRNGATTYSVALNKATFVGSIFIDGTNGQCTCNVSWGSSRKWGVSNAYNRNLVELLCGSATSSWVYNTNTCRAANAGTDGAASANTNKITVFSCLAEEFYHIELIQKVRGDNTTGITSQAEVGIGYNDTTAFSGTIGEIFSTQTGTTAVNAAATVRAAYRAPPSLGINNIWACEQSPGTGGVNTYSGTQTYMRLSARWAA